MSEQHERLWDEKEARAFFGGTKPISPANWYRGVNQGLFPKPIKLGRLNRWIPAECRKVVADRIAERDQQQDAA